MTESKSVTYESDRERTLVIEGEEIVRNERGRAIKTLPATRLIFTREGRVPTAHITEGETKVQDRKVTRAFANGEAQGLTFSELTKALDDHPGRGTMFWEAEKPEEPKSKPEASKSKPKPARKKSARKKSAKAKKPAKDAGNKASDGDSD